MNLNMFGIMYKMIPIQNNHVCPISCNNNQHLVTIMMWTYPRKDLLKAHPTMDYITKLEEE
jgi:hypothetical protein